MSIFIIIIYISVIIHIKAHTLPNNKRNEITILMQALPLFILNIVRFLNLLFLFCMMWIYHQNNSSYKKFQISQILQFSSRNLWMEFMGYFLNTMISDDDYYYLSKDTTKLIQIYENADCNLQALISASISLPLTLFIPLSFFIISKKNRTLIVKDFKFLWKKLRCNRCTATVDVVPNNDISSHVGNRNQQIVVPTRVAWISDLYESWNICRE